MPLREAGVLSTRILTAAIGMKDQAVGGTAPGQGIGQGGVDQVGLGMVGDGLAVLTTDVGDGEILK
ncbi:hypothetical protein ACWT_8102 [Actinoplanes sp. SE50]|uniref:hypothetical protein n=1 Tax=unclassified Actinoplanes TaxID=2626549 RepID=UPI00023EDD04|nr:MULTISPECIES: hypothetical protein [unclassified Actinoplanes]AEV89111.1 hypothetical protein ACPL_8233 [Actinoplanes sp. SE50/110]ATO87517.1 hypothetical protein ACWT_8102 [Actinoplanes sp. SE50]SLM04935.1 hypothetical protein ACSP50_8247 [Actinoplanes sp. SE50/110]